MTPGSFYTKRWKATPSGLASVERYESSEKGRETRRRARRAWKARNTDYQREHNRILQRVRYHTRQGHIAKTPCLVCGAELVHCHHHLGYEPEHELDVIWLCSRHHAEAHRQAEGAA